MLVSLRKAGWGRLTSHCIGDVYQCEKLSNIETSRQHWERMFRGYFCLDLPIGHGFKDIILFLELKMMVEVFMMTPKGYSQWNGLFTTKRVGEILATGSFTGLNFCHFISFLTLTLGRHVVFWSFVSYYVKETLPFLTILMTAIPILLPPQKQPEEAFLPKSCKNSPPPLRQRPLFRDSGKPRGFGWLVGPFWEVFNRRPPWAFLPFWRHFMMTRPLEAATTGRFLKTIIFPKTRREKTDLHGDLLF